MALMMIILLLLTSCATDQRRAQVKAIASLAKANYAVEELTHNPVIITVDSRDYIPGRKPGFYDADTKEIILLKNCPDYVAVHEFEHFYLDQLGIPADLHHSLIND